MADIKCPMCGKANPADAEVCRYCQARLKPLGAPPASKPAETPASGKDDVAWLRSLAGRNNPQPPVPQQPVETSPEQPVETRDHASPEPAGEEPDWLSRIRQKARDEDDAVSPIGRPPNVDEPVETQNFASIQAHPEQTIGAGNISSQPAQSKEDTSDWLASLRLAHTQDEAPAASDATGTPAQPPAEPAASSDDMDNDEWLRSFSDRLAKSTGNLPPAPQPVASEEAHPAASEPSQEDSSADLADWLKSFSAGQGADRPVETHDHASIEAHPEENLGAGVFASQAPESPGPSEPAAAPAEIPDWLKAFAAEAPVPQATPPAPQASAPVPPTPPLISPAGPAPASAEIPDWLKAFTTEQPAQPIETVAAQPVEMHPEATIGAGDLASQPATPPVPPAPEAAAPSEPEAAPAEIPDWLKSFGVEQPAKPVETHPEQTVGAGNFASLQGPAVQPVETHPEESIGAGNLASQAATSPATPASEAAAPSEPEAAPAEIPDWLKSFGVGQPAQPVETHPEQTIGAGNFASLQGPAVQPVETHPEESIGAGNLASQAATSPVPLTPEAAAPAEPEAFPGEIPDWLKSFTIEPPVQPVETHPEQTVGAGDIATLATAPASPAAPEAAPAEIPDWLKSFGVEQPAQPAETRNLASLPASPSAEPEPEAAAPAEIPDWLKEFAAKEPSPAETPPAKPDSGALLGGVNRNTGELILPASMKSEEIPDWLKSYSQRESAAPEAAPGAESAAALESEPAQPESHVSPFSESSLPEWMFGEQGGKAPVAPTGQTSAFELPAPADQASSTTAFGLPAPSEPVAPFEPSGPARPFAGKEVAHWLDTSASEQAASDEAAKGRPGDLEMAQLPAWLQAMRPVESAAPPATDNADDQRIEKSGPLAGLRGVLRGEDLVSQYAKPPAFSVKLRVSEPQTTRSSLLESLIGSESKPQATTAESQLAPHLAVRIATGLALVALILIVILYGPKPLTPAALSQVDPQAIAINQKVDALPPAAPVLVAVEYGGGLSGELRIVALPVLEHLMAKNARIVFVSTQVEGPALAESLYSSAKLGVTAYQDALKANLGYLAGGSTALRALATAPLRNSLPAPWIGDWGQPALENLTGIGDFSQVILLTDTPENGRDWVEQVQPELAKKNVPLIVLSSAQAAPMLRPYQQSGQITALLSGLVGGTAYEQIRQVSGDGTSSWNAYLAGVLAMMLFILMGGIVALSSNILSSKAKRKA